MSRFYDAGSGGMLMLNAFCSSGMGNQYPKLLQRNASYNLICKAR